MIIIMTMVGTTIMEIKIVGTTVDSIQVLLVTEQVIGGFCFKLSFSNRLQVLEYKN